MARDRSALGGDAGFLWLWYDAARTERQWGKGVDVDAWKGKRMAYGASGAVGERGASFH